MKQGQKTVRIIYGTTSGNTELVCEMVQKVLEERCLSVAIERVEKSQPEDIFLADCTILASSTYGHGILQDHFIPYAKKLEVLDFSNHLFAVIGLGDPKYDRQYNIESANILEHLVQNRDGTLLQHALRVNEMPLRHLEDTVRKWAEHLAEEIKHHPLSPSS
ncbi:flavodoxin family protein [Candidatus Peregrinibacteria bacterium]|nr:MAG: flavodoxin family protein [Candidatus Peregrinibacteria bacterium]